MREVQNICMAVVSLFFASTAVSAVCTWILNAVVAVLGVESPCAHDVFVASLVHFYLGG